MRGERNVGRGLARAQPASVDVPSTGTPLGTAEQARLEHGFGADLAQVRIHKDQPAAVAARAEHARAFVAGRDIYFDENRYDPRSSEGFNLLAHEVAHVLQQTGREGADRRLRANEAHGSGEVQFVPASHAVAHRPAPRPEDAVAPAAQAPVVAAHAPAVAPPIVAEPRKHDAKAYRDARPEAVPAAPRQDTAHGEARHRGRRLPWSICTPIGGDERWRPVQPRSKLLKGALISSARR